MRKWQDLQKLLEEMFNSKNVYYQPPENLKMEYPAIRYSKTEVETMRANNKRYASFNRYDIVVISTKPDNPVIQKILDLPYASYNRHYITNNLHHDMITLYY